MAATPTPQEQRAAWDKLPSMDSPLSLPDGEVASDPDFLEVQTFVNKLYKQLEPIPEDHIPQRKRVLRAIAPFLLLGLKCIARMAHQRILVINPTVMSPESNNLTLEAKQWLSVFCEARLRLDRVRYLQCFQSTR